MEIKSNFANTDILTRTIYYLNLFIDQNNSLFFLKKARLIHKRPLLQQNKNTNNM